MPWLLPAVIATLTGSLLLAAIYQYLAFTEKESFLHKWAIGWWIYSLRFLFMLLMVHTSQQPLLVAANQAASLLSGLFLLWGTCEFTGRKFSPGWLVATALALLWIVAGTVLPFSFLLLTLPTFLFLGSVSIWTGLTFLRAHPDKVFGAQLTGYAFILWGVHKFDYPFTRPIAWFAPWGYLLGAVLSLLVALGILLTYFASHKRKLEQAMQSFHEDEERLEALLTLHEKRTLHEKQLVAFALEEAVRLTHSEVGYFHYVDEGEKTISLNLWSEKTMEMCSAEKTAHYPLEQAGIWADSLRQRRPVVHNDYPNHPDQKGYPEGHFPIRRHLSVPVFYGNKVVAVVGVGNKQEPYSDLDIRQLQLYFSSTWDIIRQRRFNKERDEINALLQQAQKLEAVGTLAGGIAHDFNNILSAMIGFTELAMDECEQGSQLRTDLEKVYQSGLRARDLVQQILTFSRQSESERTILNPVPLVKEVVKMLRSTMPATIELVTRLPDQPSQVLADPTQLYQVVMNLATNAFHAMEEKGGRLEIELSTESLDRPHTVLNTALAPGDYVHLQVIDSGPGIGPEQLPKIFDPYFTTKEQGRGTGLGLSIVRGIIEEYQGGIGLDNRPGEGATFHIYLPVASSSAKSTTAAGSSGLSPQGSGHILLVDDEEILTDLGEKMLQRLGYTVTIAHDGSQALDIFKSRVQDFDMIISDQTMPAMTGTELAQQVFQLRPTMPFILCTGYSNKINAESAKELGIAAFLFKPLTLDNLQQALSAILAKPAQP